MKKGKHHFLKLATRWRHQYVGIVLLGRRDDKINIPPRATEMPNARKNTSEKMW